MPPCPAGSHIKPGLEPSQWIVPTALCLPIGALDGWSPWLDVLCSQLAPTLVRIDELCTSGPPPYPEINPVTLAEQGQLYIWNKNLSDFIWAAWVNANWAVLCECLPVTGPGPCVPVAEWGGVTPASIFDPPHSFGERPVGHNWTTMNAVTRNPATNSGQVTGTFRLKDAAHAFLVDGAASVVQGQSVTFIFNTANTTPAQRTNVRFVEFLGNYNQNPTVANQEVWGSISGYTGSCSQDTTTTPPPPDPYPDPPPPDAPPPPPLPTSDCTTEQLCQMIYEVLRQLQHTGQLVTLLQRYGLPFKALPGALHSGLSGSGSLAIGGLAGVQVDITSPLPPRQLEGNPPYLWDVGWMSIMTADGMIEERRITRDTQVWQPRLIQEATTFGYFFKSGVTANVLELLPEPY